MSLDDLTGRNGRILPGAFNRRENGLPIIGQKKQITWLQVGLVSIRPPQLNVEGKPDDPNWVITVGGLRSDGQMVVSAAPITQEMFQHGGIRAVVEQVGLALNFLHTYRECSCPHGVRCAAHTPPPVPDDGKGPAEDVPVDPPKIQLS